PHHRPLRHHRRTRPAGPHGRHHPAAAAAEGNRHGHGGADAGLVQVTSRATPFPPAGMPGGAFRISSRPMSLVTTLTYTLPHRLLSSLARRLAYSDNSRLKQWLIDTVTAKFGVDLSEAADSDPRSYP